MTILEQIKVLADKGATRIIINPKDFDDLVEQYGTNNVEHTPLGAIQLWGSAHCPLGKVFPAPDLSTLLQQRSYGMMNFPIERED